MADAADDIGIVIRFGDVTFGDAFEKIGEGDDVEKAGKEGGGGGGGGGLIFIKFDETDDVILFWFLFSAGVFL